MARITKAQTLAEQKLAQEAMMAELTKTYPARLMLALEMAQKFYMEVEIKNAQFMVRVPETPRRPWVSKYIMTYEFSRDSDLDLLEDEINLRQAEFAEEIRVQEAKRMALAKLTDEERKLLNL
jgi:hypothetical protein